MTNNLRFPGQYYDSETGLHYNWQRYFDPKRGQYTQVDPIGFSAGDENLYRYTFNNSLNSIDPDGQIVPLIIAGVVVVWGAVEVGLSIWDLITTVQTWLDPCEKLSTKLTTTGLFFVGMVAPGGGYGTIGKKGLNKLRTFRHYGYAKDAEKFKKGLDVKSHATHARGRPMKGTTAQEKLDLRHSKPPDAYYKVKVGSETPMENRSPVPSKYGHKGGGEQYYFPEGTPPGSVTGPFPIK